MSLFIFFFVPETKNVPTERVQVLFAHHPVWKRLMGPAAAEIIQRDQTRIDTRRAARAAEGKGDFVDAGVDAAGDAAKPGVEVKAVVDE